MRDVKEVHTTVCRQLPSAVLCICVCVCVWVCERESVCVCTYD